MEFGGKSAMNMKQIVPKKMMNRNYHTLKNFILCASIKISIDNIREKKKINMFSETIEKKWWLMTLLVIGDTFCLFRYLSLNRF